MNTSKFYEAAQLIESNDGYTFHRYACNTLHSLNADQQTMKKFTNLYRKSKSDPVEIDGGWFTSYRWGAGFYKTGKQLEQAYNERVIALLFADLFYNEEP